MAYPYQRSNYGDYYMGDPGLLGSLWKGIKGAATGLVTGGPLGAVTGAVKAITTPATPATRIVPAPPPQIPVPSTYPGALPTPGVSGFVARTLPGGATGYQAGGACPPGYHYNKALAAYERATAMGKSVKMPNVVNSCVKNRRMNPLNPRALRRSVRRQKGAVTLMRRAMAGTGYKITRSGFGTKKRTRR